MPAPALHELRRQRVPEVQALLSLRPARHPSRPEDARAADAVNRAAVVVLSAHLEGFVEDLVDDVVDVLNSSAPVTAKLPRVLMAQQVRAELEAVGRMSDMDKRAQRTEALFTTHAGLWMDAKLAPGRLSATAVSDGFGNPGAKEIVRVMKLLGISEPFAQVALSDGADAEKRINELVGIRNAIAHGGGPPVSDEQIGDYVSAVEDVATGLEDAAARHIQRVCGAPTLPWP